MKDIDFNTISKKIRETRIEKGLTQESLAVSADINPSHICNIENGKAKISLPTLVHVADALDVSLDYLIADERKNSDETYERLIIEQISNCSLKEKKRLLKLIQFLTSENFEL